MATETWAEMRDAPPWARRVDEAGNRLWPRPQGLRQADLASAIALNLVVLGVASLYPVWLPWTAGVVTTAWGTAVAAVSVGCLATVAGYVLLLTFDSPWMRHAMGLLAAVAALVSTSVVFHVYPFDFARLVGSSWVDHAVHVALFGAMVGMALGIAVRVVRLVFLPARD